MSLGAGREGGPASETVRSRLDAGTLPARLAGLASSFLRVGLFAFGGGASVVPVLREEVVRRYGWFSDEEFMDIYVVGSTIPGPIGTNLAVYIGGRVAGWPGALVAIVASTAPTAIAVIVFAALYAAWRDHPLVAGFMSGVRPVVIALLAYVVWTFLGPALGNPARRRQYVTKAVLAAACFLVAVLFSANAAILVVLGGLAGLALLR